MLNNRFHHNGTVKNLAFWGSYVSKIHYVWYLSAKISWQPCKHAAHVLVEVVICIQKKTEKSKLVQTFPRAQVSGVPIFS